MIRQIRIKATVAAGATTASTTSEFINGEILKVAFDVTGDSMDINIDSVGEMKAQAILDYTGNTDSTFYPRTSAQTNAGTAKVYLSTDTAEVPVPYCVFGKLTLSLASAAPAETVTATVTYRT